MRDKFFHFDCYVKPLNLKSFAIAAAAAQARLRKVIHLTVEEERVGSFNYNGIDVILIMERRNELPLSQASSAQVER